MGTRSLVHFEDDGKIICTVYRQFDGYPEGRGTELAEFLSNITMRNGFGMGDAAGTHANGVGCLIAQWIKLEKQDIGGIYVQAPGVAGEDDWIEYEYVVRETEDGDLEVEVTSTYDGPYFKGSPKDLAAFIKADADSEEEEG